MVAAVTSDLLTTDCHVMTGRVQCHTQQLYMIIHVLHAAHWWHVVENELRVPNSPHPHGTSTSSSSPSSQILRPLSDLVILPSLSFIRHQPGINRPARSDFCISMHGHWHQPRSHWQHPQLHIALTEQSSCCVEAGMYPVSSSAIGVFIAPVSLRRAIHTL